MVISIETQKEMYRYILSDKKTNIRNIDSNIQEFLRLTIKELAKKLYLRAELYIGKAQLQLDENNEIVRKKNYKCESNKLIYDTLHEIKNGTDFANKDIEKQLQEIDIEDYEFIPESGTADRKKLIKSCILYYQHKEIIEVSKGKSTEEYDIVKESWLAEQCLGKYSIHELGLELKAKSQPKYYGGGKYAQVLKPDIQLYDKDNLVVIDVKVYKNIHIYSHGQLKYGSNTNRFQVNSYIGKCLDKYHRDNVQGIILHIVNSDIMNKYGELQGADITIENDRHMKLWLIEDKGLDYILNEYSRLIQSIV